MNKYGVLTTAEEYDMMEPEFYHHPDEEGTFEFDMEFRSWFADRPALVCYGHDMEHHKNIRLFAWARDVDGKRIYAPKESDVDMSEVKDGCIWEVSLKKNKKGKIEWRTAEFVEDTENA